MKVISKQDLTETQWQVAHQIAIKLAQQETDVNEFKKAIAYLKTIKNQNDAGKRFFFYLTNLANNGDRIVHSKKTLEYYRNINDTCRQYLSAYQADASVMLQILGWSARLVKYYRTDTINEELLSSSQVIEPSISAKQAEIVKQISQNNFEEGQIIDAIISRKNTKGKQITYNIVGTIIKKTNKEPKYFDDLSEGQKVKVQIIKIEDEKIKNFKLICCKFHDS